MLGKDDRPETIAASEKGLSRVSNFPLWFIILFVVAIVIAFFLLATYIPQVLSADWPVLVGQAYAQAGTPPPPTDYKPLMMVAIIIVLLLVLVGSVFVMLTSTNADAVKSAGDVTKLLLGFFVGVATKFIGGA
jgi:hypothetical protein